MRIDVMRHVVVGVLCLGAIVAVSCAGSSRSGNRASGTSAPPSPTEQASPTPAIETANGTPTAGTQPTPEPCPGSLFEGELNGINFVCGYFPPEIKQCPHDKLQSLGQDEAHAAVQNSDLAFDATYLPAGASIALESAIKCGDDVVRAVRSYNVDGKSALTITRDKGEPIFRVGAPIDRMEAMMIDGRPSVLIHPAETGQPTEIVMRDDISIWLVSARRDEAIKIADGLR